MAIITISTWARGQGGEVASNVARKLNYAYITEDTIREAAQQSHISESKLAKALYETPSFYHRFSYTKERYIVYIQAALVRQAKQNNIVYHGPVDYLLFKNISHALSVHLIADRNDHGISEVRRETIPQKRSPQIQKKDADHQKTSTQYLYGVDIGRSSPYDLVLNVKELPAEDAADIISYTAGSKSFQITPQSQHTLDDLFIACEVRAHLIKWGRDVEVSVNDGLVAVRATIIPSEEAEWTDRIQGITANIQGVRKVHLQFKWAVRDTGSNLTA